MESDHRACEEAGSEKGSENVHGEPFGVVDGVWCLHQAENEGAANHRGSMARPSARWRGRALWVSRNEMHHGHVRGSEAAVSEYASESVSDDVEEAHAGAEQDK